MARMPEKLSAKFTVRAGRRAWSFDVPVARFVVEAPTSSVVDGQAVVGVPIRITPVRWLGGFVLGLRVVQKLLWLLRVRVVVSMTYR